LDLHLFPTRRSSDLFRNDDGTTRIAAMWDQSISGNPPAGYAVGSEFTREDINAVLAESGFGGFPSGSPGPVLSRDTSGHGTAVADRKSTRLNSSHVS